MDAKRFKEAYGKLQSLDDRLTYKVRPRSGTLSHATIEQLEERHRDLANYTVELKEILEELFLAIGGQSSEDKTS
jgi:hypothetical protein